EGIDTLGGTPVDADAWQSDLASAGAQKCLGCRSGMAPITYNERAERVITSRKTPIISNYFYLAQLQRYWSPERLNHHTLPTSMTYGLHEALRLIVDEGLEPRWARHQRAGDALKAGLEAMGIQLFGDTKHRLPMITAMMIPEGVPDEEGRARLLEEFGVEVATAFGPLRGRIWRIGTMGCNAGVRIVWTVLAVQESVLRQFSAR